MHAVLTSTFHINKLAREVGVNVLCKTAVSDCQHSGEFTSAQCTVAYSGVTRDSGAPRQIFKWGPPSGASEAIW